MVSCSFADTICDASLYGHPDPSDCFQLLIDKPIVETHGLESLEPRAHMYYDEDLTKRPSDVTPTQWRNKVHLAKTISSGQSHHRVCLTRVRSIDNNPTKVAAVSS